MNRAGVILAMLGIAQIVGLVLIFQGEAIAAVIVFAISHAVFLYGTLKPTSSLFGPVQCRNLPNQITIDDGPDPRTTPALLDELDRLGIKATFFLIGQRATQHPQLVTAIHEAGHSIGNHTFTHPAGRFWCIGPWAIGREIARCDEALQRITGQVPALFRSPAGHSNPFVHLAAMAQGKTIVAWSARGFDGVNTSKDKVISQIRATLSTDAIVVMHEAYDPERRGYSPAEILEAVAAAANQDSTA
ncbi:MAG: peptidoglycan/xylan/chitin deacetylase (PgdA/CDA1 family) [Verrucomicrobiales bacterium]|jgi:peptidoglycan/xylan/chitin deacetylase (PgdA/CDA1 family)